MGDLSKGRPAQPNRPLVSGAEGMTDRLERGEMVKLSSLKLFVERQKGQRLGRNPGPVRKCRFAPSRCRAFDLPPVLKQRINDASFADFDESGRSTVRVDELERETLDCGSKQHVARSKLIRLQPDRGRVRCPVRVVATGSIVP